MTNSMVGKTILITGATNGIGMVAARELARLGGQIILVSRNEEKCAAVCADIKKITGNYQVEFIAADLSTKAGVEHTAEEFLKQHTRLDVLLNNAGAFYMSRQLSADGIEIYNASISDENSKFTDHLYKKLQREGVLRSDCARMIKNDRNIFAASMLACGHGDALVTGLTRGYRKSLTDVWKVIKNKKDKILLGVSMVISKGRTIFISDTACSELSSSEHLANIAIQTAAKVRGMGYEPRVAFLSFSNFGSALKTESSRVKHAVELLDGMKVNFEYDGEMTADVALNMDKMSRYPFCRLTAPANILICPGLHSASIATKLLEEVGNCTVIGPILDGFEKSVQIVTMRSSINDILNMAAIAAVGASSK